MISDLVFIKIVKSSPSPIFQAHYKFLYLEHLEGQLVQNIKDLGLSKMLVSKLKKKTKVWFAKYWLFFLGGYKQPKNNWNTPKEKVS